MPTFGKTDKSFFWTLMSDLNPGNHPGNTPSDFVNRLPESLGIVDRENYECGLVDIRYKPVEYVPQPPPSSTLTTQEPQPKRGRMDPIMRQASEDKSPMFPNMVLDDLQILEVKKENASAERLIADIQQLLRPIGAQIERKSYEEQETMTAAINYEPTDPNTVLIFPEEISTALGFTQNSFLAGKTHSYNPVDNSKFDAIPLNTELAFLIQTIPQNYKENLMTVNTTSQYILKFVLDFSKEQNNIVTFLTQLRAKFTENVHIPIKIGFMLTSDQNSIEGKSLIVFNGNNNEELIIPEAIAKALGFRTNIITPGSHNSPDDVNVQEFQAIADGTELHFKIRNRIQYKFPLDEPGSRRLDSIMDSVNRGLHTLGLPISFNVNGDKATSQMRAGDSVQLPKAINKQLGLDEDFVFVIDYEHQSKQTNHVESFERPESEPEIETEVVQIERIAKQLLVTCSAVKNQYFGDRQYPILRILDLSQEYIKQTQIAFSPILYAPLESDNITQVRVRSLDEFGRLLNFENNPVQLTLHFRAIN